MAQKTAIIIGAGPAGLTAAYELLEKTDIKPIIFEQTSDIGGISKTVNYKGNRIDIGGHRFFSKSDRVVNFWLNILCLQCRPAKDDLLLDRVLPLKEQGQYSGGSDTCDPEKSDNVMLIRQRISRIFFLKKFFDYPISLTMKTVANLGIVRMIKIAFSYMAVRVKPVKEEKSLEDFLINRFGRELYKTFFKDYTQKVWGISCDKIKPEWGAQRIKGLSISKAIVHALKSIFLRDKSVGQKGTETSLINQFMYPKFGPGQLWEEVARIIESKGGKLYLGHEVVGVGCSDKNITEVSVKKCESGETVKFSGDYFFSTMAVKDLVVGMGQDVPSDVRTIAKGLMYRDFITVGLLLRKLKIKNETKIKTVNNIVPDNWIYVQERSVKCGRLQIFNNWSPYMVKDSNTMWIGAEYFCNEGDELWNKGDDEFKKFAIRELAEIGIFDEGDVLDSAIIRMKKTYPAYFGSYDDFDKIRNYLDGFENLFLIGRNGMHRYNNQDHSMLTAMTAVENIAAGISSKKNIWEVNTEEEYHEEK